MKYFYLLFFITIFSLTPSSSAVYAQNCLVYPKDIESGAMTVFLASGSTWVTKGNTKYQMSTSVGESFLRMFGVHVGTTRVIYASSNWEFALYIDNGFMPKHGNVNFTRVVSYQRVFKINGITASLTAAPQACTSFSVEQKMWTINSVGDTIARIESEHYFNNAEPNRYVSKIYWLKNKVISYGYVGMVPFHTASFMPDDSIYSNTSVIAANAPNNTAFVGEPTVLSINRGRGDSVVFSQRIIKGLRSGMPDRRSPLYFVLCNSFYNKCYPTPYGSTPVSIGDSTLIEVEFNAGAKQRNTLPVTLVEFSVRQAEKDNTAENIVAWHTLSESNIAQYEVERSSDGKHFGAIAALKGINACSGGCSYTYTDKTPDRRRPNLYYRLKIMEMDGSSRFSDVVAIATKINSQCTIFPNPLQEGTLRLLAAHPIVAVDLYDFRGTAVAQYRDTNLDSIDLSTFASGTYFVHIRTETGVTYSEKLFIP